MQSILKYLSLLLIIVSVISCEPGKTVKVDYFTPTGEVAKLTNFVVEFSENLAPPDVQGKWLDEEFITFSPTIPGKFKWTSDNTLVFSPDVPLEPIQKYSAAINKNVLFGTNYSPDFETYNFHTPYFDVVKIDFFWTNIAHQNYKLSVQANVQFNYPVEPQSLKDFLEVSKAGQETTDYQIVSEQAAEVIAINFGEIQQTDKKQKFTIKVKKDLVSVLGKDGLQEERNFNVELPPATKLAITNVTSGFDGNTGWIEVATTQTVDEEQLKNYVRIDPPNGLTFFVSENQFRLETDLDKVQTVDLFIKKGLPGLYGGELEFDYDQTISMVNVNPSINFTDKKGKYLMLGGEENLKVNAVNIEEAEIEVSRVFKNNLLHFLNQYSYTYSYDEHYGYYPTYYAGDYGKSIYTEKVKLSEGKNWLKSFTVNLNSALSQKYKGIYTVTVRSAEERWRNDSKMIAISDLGIISKFGKDEIYVFVNSIATTEPVTEAQVSIISTNNQILLEDKTDKDGVAHFIDVKKKTEGFYPRLVIVENNGDFNYIDLRETLIETSRYDVGGITQYTEDFNTFIYSPRNIYRPGEDVYLSAIVRNDKLEVVKDIPVLIKIITPTGKVFDEFKQELNEQGSFEISFKLPEYAQTGGYRGEVYTGSKQLIGSYNFSIEEFVPDKIRVMLSADKKKTEPGNKILINVNAEFLFGGKASGLRYEADIQLEHRDFYSKNFSSYNFANSSIVNTKIDNTLLDGVLDDQGNAVIEYNIPNGIKSSGIASVNAFVSVFDLTGRTVTRTVNVDVYPKDYFIGIKSTDYYLGVNENLTFNLITVNSDDKIIKDFKAEVELVRYEWQTVLKKDYSGNYYYASEQKQITEWKKNFDINGETPFTFAVSKSGKYDLRVHKKGSGDYQKKSFYAYGWGTSTAASFEVDKEGRIDIVFDKEAYEPGGKAKVLFTCPFSGKLLVTVERNSIQSYHYLNVENKSAEIELTLNDDQMPNAYVTATLFKKHNNDNSVPFLVGHGFASMRVVKRINKLPVAINAPVKIKPKTTQQITIKTDPQKDIFITLAAVDEGILQITNFDTPDPYKYMYAKRPLGINSYDLYKLLLPEIASESSSPGGGDMMEQLKKRTTPITVKRFKLLSYWSGIKKTNGNGEVKVSLNIPQFNGDVRLMAVAYTDSRFGAAEEHMKVADDLIMEPQVPRFLAVNDSLITPVTVINTTDKVADIEISLNVEGPLSITSSKKKTLKIEPNSTGVAVFGIEAAAQVGAGKIVFETSGFVKIKEEIDIAVRPISPLVVETGSGTIKAGNAISIDIPKNFLKGTQTTTLTISKFPAVKFAKQLKYLVGYPYGCIEQTVSKLFPQLYFEDLAKLVAPEYYKTTNPVYYVKEGIRKIETMQLYDGSMAYWQGGTYTNWWGSVYAAHFLLEAKKGGYDVSESVLNKLLKYISKKAKERKTFDYITRLHTGRTVHKIANKEILYSLYVLALAGKADIASMNYYKSRPHLVSMDMLYMLAGAYALAGRWNSYYEIVPSSYEPVHPERLTGGSFDSDIRANAIMLNVLLEVEPANTQVPLIIKYLTSNSKDMYSTQERAFAFLALGKAAGLNADANVTVDIIADGEKINKFTGNDLTVTDNRLDGAIVNLKATGDGEVYYFWNAEGVKINEKVKEEDSYVQIRRSYYGYKTGRKIFDNIFYQGELIVCKIVLTGFERGAENIIISDLIPAGFEIENPRLNPATELTWVPKNPLKVDYMDIRDDRLLLFTNLNRKKSNEFYYLLRVVNQGTFQLPVIGAEAMYDREYHSYHGAGIVKVLERRE
ncbi:MAG: MG2 domain-containing protein [Ignavibacteriaceae bacterium]